VANEQARDCDVLSGDNAIAIDNIKAHNIENNKTI
jgi:hypothetical protein